MSDEQFSDLPLGWEWTTLDQCVEVLDRYRVPINSTERDARIANKPIDQLFPYYGATQQVGWIDDYIFDEELVLLGEDGVPFLDPSKHKAYLIAGKSWVNNHAHVLRAIAGLTTNGFILHYLNQFDFFGYVTGTTRLKLNQSRMNEIPVPLPPLSEQRRIVEKIEALFEQSRTARAALDAIPPLIQQFRQSVLAAAFRGDLTERDPNDEPAYSTLERILQERRLRWEESLRAQGKDPRRYEYRVPAIPDGTQLPELPEGWIWVSTELLASDEQYSFTDGPFGSNLKTADYVASGVRVIRLQNLGVAQFKNEVKAYVTHEKYLSLQKHEACAGDILISALAEPVGRACLVPDDLGVAIVKADCVRLKVDPYLAHNAYVMYSLNSPDQFKRAEELAHGVGRLRVNLSDIRSFLVPLAPLNEQYRIAEKIQTAFNMADSLMAIIEHARRYSETIDQSILARAFRGELVPQDPNDEPASVLLERIRSEAR